LCFLIFINEKIDINKKKMNIAHKTINKVIECSWCSNDVKVNSPLPRGL
jgi:hypothetical protein